MQGNSDPVVGLMSYPGWHTVSVRIAVVEVEDEYCEQDTAGHHPHDKVEICSFIETLSLSSLIGVASGLKQKDYRVVSSCQPTD